MISRDVTVVTSDIPTQSGCVKKWHPRDVTVVTSDARPSWDAVLLYKYNSGGGTTLPPTYYLYNPASTSDKGAR